MDTGPESIEAASALAQVRRQASRLFRNAVLVAAVITAIVTAVPR